MIVLSIGMPRAGSGWFFNLTNDLLISSGFQDVRIIREKYHLQRILTEVNCNIGAFSLPRLAAVMVPSFLGNKFVVKAHAGSTMYSNFLIQIGSLQLTYIFRDPRDAMLSAMEYGKRGLQNSRPNAFSHLKNFNDGMKFIQKYIRIWDSWIANKHVFYCRYEDLLLNYNPEVNKLVRFLNLDSSRSLTQKIIEKYHPEATLTDNRGLHFRKGKIGRFRESFSQAQQDLLAEKFANYLERMGYQI